MCEGWWRRVDSNHRHRAYETPALPTELRRHRRKTGGMIEKRHRGVKRRLRPWASAIRLPPRSREVSEKELAKVIGWRFGLSKLRRLRASSECLRMREIRGRRGSMDLRPLTEYAISAGRAGILALILNRFGNRGTRGRSVRWQGWLLGRLHGLFRLAFLLPELLKLVHLALDVLGLVITRLVSPQALDEAVKPVCADSDHDRPEQNN